MQIKKNALFLITLFFLSEIQAQNFNYTIGIKLFPEIATLNGYFGRIAFGGGAYFIRYFPKYELSLETGLYVLDKGSGGKKLIYGTGSFDVIGETRYAKHYYFIGIPILLRTHRNIFYSSFGGSLEYYLSQKFVNSETIFNESDYHKLNFAININGGINVPLNQQINLSAEGRFSYNLIPLHKDFSQKFMNFGIGIGGNYNF